ncbi:hypothetical protein V6O07_15275, partial [Arthrospira platensis SPKY2]
MVGLVTEFAPDVGKQVTGLSYTAEYLADVIDEFISQPEVLEENCDGLAYGSSTILDTVWDLCDEGRYWACDVLYELSDPESEYHWFGATCGDRVDTEE